MSLTRPNVVTVWDCDCSGVQVEPAGVAAGHTCKRCGAVSAQYVAVDALLSVDAVSAGASNGRRCSIQMAAGVLSAAVDAVTGKQGDA